MSYSGSHHQFGHNDLQLLQNRVMIARLQELQKQQQSQSPMTTHLSRFGKQASGGHIPNLSGGMYLNSSDIFAANNMNWMHHNISPPMHGFPSNSYLHDPGLMMNPSFYGTPVASGRPNMGQYPPLQGVPPNSIQKNMSLLDYSGIHGQNGSRFLHEESKPTSDVRGTAELDPLEEKILFDTEDSGWDSSLSKLAALDVEEFANSSEAVNPFSSVQSGSWSALMQSAVAEVSSGDAGVQEELSGLSYQNIELSTENQPSNLVTGTSSGDSIISSTLPSFQQTALQSSFERGLNKFSSDINIEQWSHISQQSNQQVTAKHVGNDVFRGSGSSFLSASDMNRDIYGQIQHRSSDHQNMSIADGTLNQLENKSKSPRYDETPLENGPMSVDAANKNADQTYACQNYQGENSSDSYNSKASHGCAAQRDHVCLNAADSESSARSSQKSPNQVKQNQSEDVLSKHNPPSNIVVSTAMDSKNAPKRNTGNSVSDHGVTTQFDSAITQIEHGPSQDIFSFQSSMFGDSVPANSRNEQKGGQSWWMPSSFGPSVPPLQGPLAQNWTARSSNIGNSGFEIPNPKSEGLPQGSNFPGPLCAPNQIEARSVPDMSIPSRDSSLLENTSIPALQNYASGALQNSLQYMSHLNQLGMKPHSVQMSMPSQRAIMVDPFNGSFNLHNVSTLYANLKDQSSLVDPSARNSEIAIDNQGSGIQESAEKSNQMVTNQVLASSVLPANADDMNLILTKSRKRKFSAYGGLPWHLEVVQNWSKLPDIRIAEQGWAKATNRLVEERVNENDTLEEVGPVARGKKRLIVTSQLMQQVFQPPSPSILRVDAASDYEFLVYFVAKVALADTCKLISKPRIHIPHEYGAMLINASSNAHDSLLKFAEVLLEKVTMLESRIEGLDTSWCTVDIRRECQELEKYSLINHFAKYHSQSAQSNTTNDTQSPFLQKYVTPTPLPQKFPEGTKCISL